MDRDASVHVRIRSALSCQSILLEHQGFPCAYRAVLKYYSGIAEDEIDSTPDLAVLVKLAKGMGVEDVLVPNNLTAIEDGFIRSTSKSYRLVFLWTCNVYKLYISGNETLSDRSESCTRKGCRIVYNTSVAQNNSVVHSISNYRYQRLL